MIFVHIKHQQNADQVRPGACSPHIIDVSKQFHHERTGVGLVHPPNEFVDEALPVTVVATLDVVNCLLSPAAGWIVQLERPQEIADFLEVGTHSEDLMDNVLHANDPVLSECLLDLTIAGERMSSMTIKLPIAPFVDEFPGTLEIGITPGNVRFHQLQHTQGGLVQLDKDAIVDPP